MNRPAPRFSIVALCLALAAGAAAQANDSRTVSLTLPEWSLLSQPESDPVPPAAAPDAEPEPEATKPELSPEERRKIPYGYGGGRWLTFGGAIANDFDGNTDANAHVAISWFLADELEWGIEGAGWGFFQEGDDTGGVSGSLLFRWHFLHDEDFTWSFFGDVGIGLLAAFNTVPDGGTGFNFLPRAGIGGTFRLDEESQTRLMLGLRWHHISNGRIEGDENNPARDAIMFYMGVSVPF